MKIRTLLSFITKCLYQNEYQDLRSRIITLRKSFQPCFKSDLLVKFLISGEDHRFIYHIGFDFIAILRAIKNRLLYSKIEGASTIEQQFVRVIMNDYEKTISRKIREILLSTTLSDIMPRRDIPMLYLYIAYYGTDMQGIKQVFDNLNIIEITEEIAAEIIARIKYPEPKRPSETRIKQISLRKEHLLLLYKKHSTRKIMKIYG